MGFKGGAGTRRWSGVVVACVLGFALLLAAPAPSHALGGLFGTLDGTLQEVVGATDEALQGVVGETDRALTEGADTADGSLQGILGSLEDELQALVSEVQAATDAASDYLERVADGDPLATPPPLPDLSKVIADSGLGDKLNEGSNLVPLAAVLAPVSDLLCPTVSSLDDTLRPVPLVGEVTGLARALACNLGQLSFRFYTTWRAPNGDLVVRTHQALIGVPTLLDVDNDPGPDLSGTIDFGLGLDSVTLTIDRAGDTSKPLAASVEAIIDDLGAVAGKESVAFGYDQLADRVPARFRTRIGIAPLLQGGDPRLDLDITQTTPGTSTSVIGGFFDGTPQNRENATSFRLDYARSPGETGLLLDLGDPLGVQITTDVTGPLTATLNDTRLNARAIIADLPNVLDLKIGNAEPTIRYTGADSAGNPQSIQDLDLAVSANTPLFGRASFLRIAIDDLPSGTEVAMDSAGERLGLTASRAIGAIEAFAGSEPEKAGDLPQPGSQGVNYIDRASQPFVLGARIFALEQLEAALGGGDVALTARTAGGPFDLHAKLDSLEADALIRDLPPVLDLGFDTTTGALRYSGSAPIDSIDLDIKSASPLISQATELALRLEQIPSSFEIGLAPDGDGLAFAADNPIGKITAKATSAGAADESTLIGPDDAGAVLRDVGDDFFLFARLFDMRELKVGLSPLSLVSKMESGRVFTADAKLEQEGGEVAEITARIDKLPAEMSIGIADGAETKLELAGSSPIELLELAVKGIELLDGADDLKVAVHDMPTEVTVELPESGPLVDIRANDKVGQVRLAAGTGDVELPARSIAGDTVLRDLFRFRSLPGELAAALRLSAIDRLSVALDPVNITLGQDAARTRAIDLDAVLDVEGTPASVTGLLDKPGASTSMSVQLDPDQPTQLVFDNSHNMSRFELNATGLSGINAAQLAFDNLSRRMTICMDPGPACQRPNPNSVARYATGATTGASINLDDHGTHGSGTGPAFRTTLNANIAFDDGAPVTVENLRFRNLGFDFQDANNPHSSNCGTIPRISLFIDSRGHPFVINSLRYPPTINEFQLGTDGNPARARNRIARLNGWATGILGCLGGLSTQSAGALACGGASVLQVQTALGNINVLNFLGFQLIPLCGGTVSNPQPW